MAPTRWFVADRITVIARKYDPGLLLYAVNGESAKKLLLESEAKDPPWRWR